MSTTWNIQSKIFLNGYITLVFFFGVIVYAYGFTRSGFLDNGKILIEATNDQTAKMIGAVLNDRAKAYSNWVKDDLLDIDLDFGTTNDLKTEFRKWLAQDRGFLLLTVIDKNGLVIEAATSSSTLHVANLEKRLLIDFKKLEKPAEDDVRFLFSKTLADLGLDRNETYMFYHPIYDTDGSRNGAFVAYMDWAEIDEQVAAYARDLKGYGYEGARVVLAYPREKAIISNVHASGAAFDKDSYAPLLGWALDNGVNRVARFEVDEEALIIGCSPVPQNKLAERAVSDLDTPVLLATIPEGEMIAKLYAHLIKLLLIGVMGVSVILLYSYFIAQRISRGISEVAALSLKFANGDVNQSVDVKSNDEIGTLASAFRELGQYIKDMAGAAKQISTNDLTVEISPRSEDDLLGNSFKMMLANFNNMMGRIRNDARTLVSASETIDAAAKELAKGSEEVVSSVNTSAANSEQISGNIDSVAASVEEMSTNIATMSGSASDMSTSVLSVSAAIEEMTSSLAEVSKNSNMTSNIAQEANETAKQAATKMTSLDDNASKIGKVVETINDIADKTNLLALNATIEAASAGEAGKGFAVVANEVKVLSKQTAQATMSIKEQVESMQKETSDAVVSISNILEVIKRVTEISSTVAYSVEEQSAAINEIARSFHITSDGAETVSANANELAFNTSEVSRLADKAATSTINIVENMGNATGATDSINHRISEISHIAEDLKDQAGSLNDIVDQFKVARNDHATTKEELHA